VNVWNNYAGDNDTSKTVEVQQLLIIVDLLWNELTVFFQYFNHRCSCFRVRVENRKWDMFMAHSV